MNVLSLPISDRQSTTTIITETDKKIAKGIVAIISGEDKKSTSDTLYALLEKKLIYFNSYSCNKFISGPHILILCIKNAQNSRVLNMVLKCMTKKSSYKRHIDLTIMNTITNIISSIIKILEKINKYEIKLDKLKNNNNNYNYNYNDYNDSDSNNDSDSDNDNDSDNNSDNDEYDLDDYDRDRDEKKYLSINKRQLNEQLPDKYKELYILLYYFYKT